MKKLNPKRKWLKRILVTLGVIFVLLALLLTQPWAFLPHNAKVSLPFPTEEDNDANMIPMGTIEEFHNASTGLPDGHPGMDFAWNREAKITAIGDGLIIAIYKNHEDKFIVEQFVKPFFRSAYQELNDIDPKIKPFTFVKKGQLIGHTGFHRKVFTNEPPKPTDPSAQMHWDFSYSSLLVFRLCPLEYLEEDSRKRIEKIWQKMKDKNQYSKEYPDICNGAYKSKNK